MALLEASGVGRDINRHRYARGEAEAQLGRPVVADLLKLIRLRNEHPAFSGYFRSLDAPPQCLDLVWTHGVHEARLQVDFARLGCALTWSDGAQDQALDFETAALQRTHAGTD